MQRPPILQKGDTIGLMATARFLESDKIEVVQAMIHSFGFKTRVSEFASQPFHQFGGNDQQRASDLQSFLEDPGIKAIWAVRGGYGTVRILDLIDWSSFQSQPKWICGYSDLTALHGRAHHLGIQSLHCTLPVDFPRNEKAVLKSTFDTLSGGSPNQNWSGNHFDIKGQATGSIKGGNLSVLYSLLGSDDFPNLQDSILFIEDIDEYVYHIDRMLRGMKRAKVFDGLSGVVVGGMTHMNDHTIPFGWSAEELIRKCFEDLEIPVAFQFPAGHVDNNMPIIFGADVLLSYAESGWKLQYQ